MCASNYVPRLKEQYLNTIRASLSKKFGYKNLMQAPKLLKIAVNMGVKEALTDSKAIDKAMLELMSITGQKPVVTKAIKSVAGFKLKAGAILGCKVTLRENMMYDFLDRLVNIALPRVRDFKGFSKSQCDTKGTFSIGIKEHVIFPEIDYDKVDRIRGMNITFVSSSKSVDETVALLESFSIPFR